MKVTNIESELKKLAPRYFAINKNNVYAYDKVSVFDEKVIGVAGAKYQIISLPSGAKVAAHFHKNVKEIFLIASGKGKIMVNKKSFEAKAGDIFLIRPGDHHALENLNEVDFVLHIFKWNEDPADITWA